MELGAMLNLFTFLNRCRVIRAGFHVFHCVNAGTHTAYEYSTAYTTRYTRLS